MMEAGNNRLKIGCVVMAAGASTRFGANKLVADLDGLPVISRTLAALPLSVERVVVVSKWESVAALCHQAGIRCIDPNGPDHGDTVRTGIEEMVGIDGCLFLPGDQPLVTSASIDRVVRAFEEDSSSVVRLAWNGTPGSPVLFPQNLFAALGRLKGEQGGSVVLRREAGFTGCVRCVEADAAYELEDIDTPDDLERLQKICREVR